MSNIARPVYKQVSVVTGYKTSDGRFFDNQVDADIWQHKVNRYEEVCEYFQSKIFEHEKKNPDKKIIDRRSVRAVFRAIFFDFDLFDAECFLARTREKYDTNIS
ncbi:MAG: hypothetical protein IM613_12360 [Cytophagales bacterium]|jgi:CRISPR/Cas system CSM-associated protein Csm3 (group 7 of RAMP superfamily)|nr:hypothetical protein [Cytophagales bacterium]